MTTRLSFRSMVVVLAAGLCACAAVGPDYQRPTVAQPASYKEIDGWKPVAPQEAASGQAWWSIYRDPMLDTLEPQIEVSNESLKATEAGYRQALEIVNESRAGYAPIFTAGGAGQRARQSTGTVQNEFDLTVGASWAPDLWGRIRRTVESSTASAQASAADLASARLSLQATLATDYFALRVDDAMKELLEQTVANYQAALEITRTQNQFGTAAGTDVITAETQLEGARAQLVGVGVQRAQLEHAIGVLVGKTPDTFAIPPGPLASSVPVVPAGMPSTLLERRPDIAAAERTAAAASAQIGVATAAYYPDISLVASLGFAGPAMGGLLSASHEIWSLGPQLSATLLDGGLRHAQVAAARAAYDQSVATYRQTVLSAFSQVEDELAALRILEQQWQAQQRAVALAREAAELTINQYQAGTAAYTAVVTAQTTALADEQSALTTQGSRLAASVALVSALGGGWDVEMLAESTAQAAANAPGRRCIATRSACPAEQTPR